MTFPPVQIEPSLEEIEFIFSLQGLNCDNSSGGPEMSLKDVRKRNELCSGWPLCSRWQSGYSKSNSPLYQLHLLLPAQTFKALFLTASLSGNFLQYSSQTWSLFLCLAFSCVCGALPDSSLPYHVFHHHSGSVLECCTPGVFFVISLLSTLSPTTVSSTQQTERSFYNLSQITLFFCSKLPPIALSVSLRIEAKVIIEIKMGLCVPPWTLWPYNCHSPSPLPCSTTLTSWQLFFAGGRLLPWSHDWLLLLP